MSTVAIEKFLQTAYSDEKLAALLAHAEDGKLRYTSCCCLIGVANADHPLRQDIPHEYFLGGATAEHYLRMKAHDGAFAAETEYCALSPFDEERRALVIPIIRAEIARRDALKEFHCPCGDTCPTCDPESALEAQQQAEECSDMDVFHRY